MYSFIKQHEARLLWFAKLMVLLALAMPLLFAPRLIVYPFITPKVFLFQIVVGLGVMAYGLLLLIDFPKYRPPRSLLTLLLLAWLAWLLISALLGVDFWRSFWANPERMVGVISIVHYLLWYVLLIALFRTKRDWQKIFMLLLGSGVLVLLLGVWQHFVPGFLTGGSEIQRIASTLGNPIYLSLYAFYLLVISIYIMWLTRRGHGAARMITLGLGLLGAITILVLIWAKTRGAFVGAAAFVIWIAVFGALLGTKRWIKATSYTVLFIAVLGAALLAFGPKVNSLQSLPLVTQASNFSLHGGSIESRLRAWGVAIDVWKERPIAGWGWFNFEHGYNKWYRPEQLKHGLGETWFDSPHNMLLDILTTTGGVGLLLYTVVWVFAIALLLLAWRRDRIPLGEFILFSGLLVFHFVQNFFVFEHPVSYLMLFLILAFIALRTQGLWYPKRLSKRAGRTHLVARSRVPFTAAALIFLGVATLYYSNVAPYRALSTQAKASAVLAQGDLGQWLFLQNKALAIRHPHVEHIRAEMGSDLLVITIAPEVRTVDVDGVFAETIEQLEENVRVHPRDVRRHLELGEVLMKRFEYFPDLNPDIPAAVDRIYERASDLSPQRQQVLFLHARALTLLNQFQKAQDILYQTRALTPSLNFVHRFVAPFLEEAGLYDEAITTHETSIRISVRRAGDKQGLETEFHTPRSWEDFGLLHIEHGNTQRGAWFLEEVVACATKRVPWRFCERNSEFFYEPYRPSKKAFAALVLYYEKKGDDERSAFYDELAREYYVDFEIVEENEK